MSDLACDPRNRWAGAAVVLLLAALLAATGCGPGPSADPYEQSRAAWRAHDEAAERIEQLGGRVEMRDPGTAVTIQADRPEQRPRALQSVRHLQNVYRLAVIGEDGATVALSELGAQEQLRHLILRDVRLDRADFQYMKGLAALEELTLIGAHFEPALAPSIAELDGLRRLHLAYVPVGEKAVAKLAQLPRLQHLRLVGLDVSAKLARRLTRQLPNLLVELNDQTFRGRQAR